MRKEYKRSDFTRLEPGRFHAEARAGTCVALLDPAVAKAFPTSKAVNDALQGLLRIAEQASLGARAPMRRPKRGAAAR